MKRDRGGERARKDAERASRSESMRILLAMPMLRPWKRPAKPTATDVRRRRRKETER